LQCEIQGRDTPAWEYAKSFQTFSRPVAGENSVDIEVRLNGMPETLNGSFSGNLVIKVNHPEKSELKLRSPACAAAARAAGPDTPVPDARAVPAPAGQGGTNPPPKLNPGEPLLP